MQASLGNSFHLCFGAALGVTQQKSYDSERLVEMLAADVKMRVNQSLALISEPASITQLDGAAAELERYTSDAEDMVFHIVHILRRCKIAQRYEMSCKDCPDSDYSDCSWSDEVTDEEEFYFADCTEEELSQQDTAFLTAFLKKLIDHITNSKTSRLNLDLDRMLSCLREKAVGELSYNLPTTVGNIHIPVCKKLTQQFGSAKLLQAAMMSNEGTFEEAVVKILKAQLQKTEENVSFLKKVRRSFCKRISKVAPLCEENISVSPSEAINQDKEPTLTKKKCPAVIKMLPPVARTLIQTLTCCISNGSKDH